MDNLYIIRRQREQTEFLYNYVKDLKPNVIVELGVGGGGYTVAMAQALKEVNPSGKIHSYEILPLESEPGDNDTRTCSRVRWMQENNLSGPKTEMENRKLIDMWTFTEGDCHETFVKNPFAFDLLLIDAAQDWNGIYKIVIENDFINNQIQSGAKVIIEGGAKRHPVINTETFKEFSEQFDKSPFTYECVAVGTNRATPNHVDMSSLSTLTLEK